MRNLFVISNTFTGQTGPDDCGIACLAMLLNYAGRYDDGNQLIAREIAPSGGYSLYDLRSKALEYSLPARCVKMDIAALQNSRSPCILHTIGTGGAFHFVVCFSAKKRGGSWQFLIGDPAAGLMWISQNELERIWIYGAALYSENLRFAAPRLKDLSIFSLFGALSSSRMLFVSIPLLHLFATILGIALSWLLQRGINDPFAEHKTSLIIAVIVLLAFIMTGRNVGNYLKQIILIRLNCDIRRKYLQEFHQQALMRPADEASIRKGLANVQKIQNGVSAMFAVLISDGFLVSLLTAGLWYFEPAVGLINSVYVIIMLFIGAGTSSLLISRQSALTEMAAANERTLLDAVAGNQSVNLSQEQLLAPQEQYAAYAQSLAKRISEVNLIYECFGTVNVIIVLCCGLYDNRHSLISYNMLITEVIASYFITMLAPKLCQSFPVISEGARLARQFDKLN